MLSKSARNPVLRFATIGVTAVVMMAMSASTVGAAQPEPRGVVAEFKELQLDLSADWGDARACFIWEQMEIVKCFLSEEEMDSWVVDLDIGLRAGPESAGATCSGYLRLYDGTSYSGSVLYLRDRGVWLNLSSYGFNQKTSSFKVGPCSSLFADYNNGGGARYPSYLTAAYDQSSSMISGWNNDVSSVYIG